MGLRIEENLYQKAGLKFERHYGLVLIQAPDAKRFFEWCLENEVGVIGFDTFIIHPGETRPLIKWSPDLSLYRSYPNFSENSAIYSSWLLQEIRDSEGDSVYLEIFVVSADARRHLC